MDLEFLEHTKVRPRNVSFEELRANDAQGRYGTGIPLMHEHTEILSTIKDPKINDMTTEHLPHEHLNLAGSKIFRQDFT